MTTYRKLGRSGLHLFPIGLGSMQFGWSADEQTSQGILDAYYAAGGNFVDTANGYQDGSSEAFIGEWMEARGVRDQMVIATKVRLSLPSPLRLPRGVCTRVWIWIWI